MDKQRFAALVTRLSNEAARRLDAMAEHQRDCPLVIDTDDIAAWAHENGLDATTARYFANALVRHYLEALASERGEHVSRNLAGRLAGAPAKAA
jgi:hypothetical protein